jgi:hypothetical protein
MCLLFCFNNKLISKISSSNKLPLPTPTSIYKKKQKFEDLIWKKYVSKSMGISFDYPENLDHYNPDGKNLSALKIENNILRVSAGMEFIFSIGKNDVTKLEEYVNKIDKEIKKSNTITKTIFRNKQAYYFASEYLQQVPTDYYIVQMNGYLLIISFEKHRPFSNEIIYTKNNTCDFNSLYQYKDREEYFYKFDNQIILRIMNSIELIQ